MNECLFASRSQSGNMHKRGRLPSRSAQYSHDTMVLVASLNTIRGELEPMEIQSRDQTVRAAAAGRLLLKEFNSWKEFDDATKDISGNRRDRRAKKIQLKGNIKSFLRKNFQGATEEKLAKMWSILSEKRGIRLNMPDFEKEFFVIREENRLNVPDHAVVDISLWGLGFDFPEKQLADSLAESVRDLKCALTEEETLRFQLRRHREKREEIRAIPRRQQHCCRSILFFSHALIECFINGMAWKFLQGPEGRSVSERKRKQLEDKVHVEQSKKLRGFDGILFDQKDANLSDGILEAIETSKSYRDSITHPSPFAFQSRSRSVPEFGKLDSFYSLDSDAALKVANAVKEYIESVEVNRSGRSPFWLQGLVESLSSEMP